MSNASSITMNPILSHKSSNSGAGGLCEQRIPLHPISFRICNCLSIALVFTAAPRHPRSWCIHTPLILVCLPFRINPFSASNLKSRTPVVVVYLSIHLPSLITSVTREYKYGFSISHNLGDEIFRVWFISDFCPATTETDDSVSATIEPSISFSIDFRVTVSLFFPEFCTVVTMFNVALLLLISEVVT